MRPWGVKRLFRPPTRTADDVRRDVVDEFEFHVDMRIEDLMRDGLSAADARAEALREFGDRAAGARVCAETGYRDERARRVSRWLEQVVQDARYGARLLVRSPAFAAVAILTLGIGIGANTAIYSVLDALLLRPLPFPEPERLVMVSETPPSGNPNSVSGGAYLDWRANQTQFEAIALTSPVTLNLRGTGAPERLSGMEVSHEFLRVLGVPLLLGRDFLAEEDRPGGRSNVVIITEELWRSHFGADRDLVGRSITLDDVPRTVIGILPKGTWVMRGDSFFVPAVLEPNTDRARRSPHWAAVFGRIGAAATVKSADAELKAIKQRLNSEYPAFKQQWGVIVQPATDVIAGVTRAPVLILLGAVSLVLLIASVNVANLLLARGYHRQQELAVRAALGAGGARIVRQVLTENVVLAAVGGLVGVGLAYLGVAALHAYAGDVLPFTFAPRVDVRVLGAAVAITLVTGVIFGALPALVARRPDLTGTLNHGAKGTVWGGRQRTQAVLVITEVALTVVLLSAAGLLLRSLTKIASADPGFEPARVLAFDLSLPDRSYVSRERRLAFVATLLEQLRALPGVEGAGTGMSIPFAGGGYGEYFLRPDRPVNTDRDLVLGRLDFVSPGYLEALGTHLLAGRRFVDTDNQVSQQGPAVISATAVRRLFPDRSPIGQTLQISGNKWTVIGVVADVVDKRLDVERRAFAYVPNAFNASRVSVVIRTNRDPLAFTDAARTALQQIDSGVAMANPRALDRAMGGSMLQRRAVLLLIGVFAGVALLLASIGLYGVMAYAVATRSREFGIRLALGAMRGDVVRQVLRRGLVLITVGVVLGLGGAMAASRLLASELYQVRGTDPAVVLATVATLVAVALIACWLPARRAGRFDPITVLRSE
jgi:putative ABC transport system permease protein